MIVDVMNDNEDMPIITVLCELAYQQGIIRLDKHRNQDGDIIRVVLKVNLLGMWVQMLAADLDPALSKDS